MYLKSSRRSCAQEGTISGDPSLNPCAFSMKVAQNSLLMLHKTTLVLLIMLDEAILLIVAIGNNHTLF
jgi:hypothetical protein